MNRSLFVIKEMTTGTYCTSSKSSLFNGFEFAAFFMQRENADKAVKLLSRSVHCRAYNPKTGNYEHLGYPEFKVVPCTVTPGE